jgi:trypsin-like peptidase/effector-associated domain 1 (EAD1)-containing protein
MRLDLDVSQRRYLHRSLLSAFPSPGDLKRMVGLDLGHNLLEITDADGLANKVYDLIVWADSRGALPQLIGAAVNANPTNPDLREFCRSMLPAADRSSVEPFFRSIVEALGLSPKVTGGPELERIIVRSARFSQVEKWRMEMARCEQAVGRVECPEHEGVGSAFLIGPDLVITNYHVVRAIAAARHRTEQVVLRFDYKAFPDGQTLRSGETVRLAADWLVAHDTEDRLDFAIARLERPVGDQHVGRDAQAPLRGWLVPQPVAIEPGAPVFVIQHPRARPLAIAAGVLISGGPDRLSYTANTEPGSSGSPCFTSDWGLLALHRGSASEVNQGVPLASICEFVRAAGLVSVFRNA